MSSADRAPYNSTFLHICAAGVACPAMRWAFIHPTHLCLHFYMYYDVVSYYQYQGVMDRQANFASAEDICVGRGPFEFKSSMNGLELMRGN